MARRGRYPLPVWRPLRVYAFDPGLRRRFNNVMTIQVPYEPLEPGPVGDKLAVIDYDATNEYFYDPVNLDHPSVLIGGGLAPSESDPHFHQQMVYAVASDTIRHFEFALGRPVRWRTRPGSRVTELFHSRLRIFPHAFQQANAFYDPRLRAVVFGYFRVPAGRPGESLPGQTIFTCLSHDVVVHEMTHALVDGQREYLLDATSHDAPAFQEAFADIVALFQHFSYKEALLETIHRTGGYLHRPQLDPQRDPAGQPASIMPELTVDNPLVTLAQQFGQARGGPSGLRSALGTPPNSSQLATTTEAHARGAILVSAVFDAYFTAYVARTQPLIRLARAGGAINAYGDLHPDLADQLAREAAKTAGHFLNMCIRALDYCPPVDLKFGEFLRALITADSDLSPDDEYGYRTALVSAFRARGIIPEEVASLSEESLLWLRPADTGQRIPACDNLQYGVSTNEQPSVVRQRDADNAKRLHAYGEANRAALGLVKGPKVQVQSYRPVHRVGPGGRLMVDFVVEFLQQRREPIDPRQRAGPTFQFRGGSTVIFDNRGTVRYVITKRLGDAARLMAQREFHVDQLRTPPAAAYVEPACLPNQINFQLVHGVD